MRTEKKENVTILKFEDDENLDYKKSIIEEVSNLDTEEFHSIAIVLLDEHNSSKNYVFAEPQDIYSLIGALDTLKTEIMMNYAVDLEDDHE